MKKLLAVATIGVVGYLVVKKIKERKNNEVEVNEEMENEEVVENVEEELAIDNDEEIEVEIVDNMEVEENNVINKMKDLVVKAPIKLAVKVCGFICGLLIKVNKRLKNVKDIDDKDLMYMGDFEFYAREIGLIMGGLVIDINRKVILALAAICKMMNKIL